MSNNGIVNIHGKDYMTVARRLELAHEDSAIEGLETHVLNHNPVVVKAKVLVKGKIFTGVSSVSLDSAKFIEKQNPYEVAETSAVGRALGFAGYGLIESVASADEMIRATATQTTIATPKSVPAAQKADDTEKNDDTGVVVCEVCGEPASEKKGTTRGGKNYHGIFCSTDDKSHTRWLWN
jgi:hypothetical protein